ncbi:MAG: Smr/MutS family protein [Myxococcota bacterium]|nr:Smr/MutS family protein [Myxococcota bacterium]
MRFSVEQKTLERLEWPQLQALWADQCRTPQARAQLIASDGNLAIFGQSASAVRERLTETTEARSLIDAGKAPGLGGIDRELETAFVRAATGGALTGDQLRDVGSVLAALDAAGAQLSGTAGEAPRLADLADAIGDHGELARGIERCIDPSGEVRDQASPSLGEARALSTRLASELRQRLERMLRNDDVREALSDEFVTVRNDRYVLPVRSDRRGRVRGIIHDASNSGSTVFIEPEGVVGLNNRLKQAELDVARETERVLRSLTHELALVLPSVRASLAVLIRIDLAFARGHLSQAMDATPPEIDESGRFELRALRHPLIPVAEAVPSDVELGRDFNVLVISGPNAGGKTVALKALALAALCVRAGLHVSAAAGARVGLIDALLADIGDEQDIRQNLSTFSAHLANLATVVREATPRSLVVLDEIGVGTDPSEGAAIAQSVLERLADAGARVVTTTHYNLLKEMAEVDSRFRNASVEFEAETLAPTYRLRLGAAGASSATAVAARMGMPAAVLERANALLDREDRQLDRMLSELAANRSALEREQRETVRLRAQSEATRDEYRAKLERLQHRRDELFRAMRDDLDRAFHDAHTQVAAVIRDLQRSGSAQGAAHARERLQSLEQRAQTAASDLGIATPPEPSPSPGSEVDWRRARPGDAVLVRGSQPATLEMLPDRRGKVVVSAGSARLVLAADQVRAVPSPAAAEPTSPRVQLLRAEDAPGCDDAALGGWLECDLRGMRVHEALDRLSELLDRAAAESRDAIRVVHGIGTGALRSAVREHLASSPLVKDVRSGDPAQGGEGLTEAELV